MNYNNTLTAARYASTPPDALPPYGAHAPMVTHRDVGEGLLPTQQDAWERPPAPRTRWQSFREEACAGDDEGLCLTFGDVCRRVVTAVLCVLTCGDS